MASSLPRLGIALSLALSLAAAAAVPLTAQEFDRPDPRDEGMTTGPAVGERIPDFVGIDQHGKRVSWDEIKGPSGALILFYRSADW